MIDNYIVKLLRMREAGQLDPARDLVLEIRHSAWCGLLVQGRRCDCDPDVSVVRSTPKSDTLSESKGDQP